MHEDETQPKKIFASVLAVLLWIVTAILGLLDILAVRHIARAISARLWSGTARSSYWALVNVSNWSVVAMALVWIVVVVGGGEFHRSRVGQRSSWRLFGWTIGVEVAIYVLSLFV
jgi:hypothetical protein